MDWLDWLRQHTWETWTGLAILLAVAELLSLDLVLLMLAFGALVGGVAALVGLPGAAQVLVAVGASVAMLTAVRPSVVRRMRNGPGLVLGHQKLVGQQGVVISAVSADGGQVRVGGEVWTARPYEEGVVIEEGARVDIFEIRGATVVVHKMPELNSET
jgi:membrane protein implicated in regulation of membrane protease activity